MVVVAVMIMVMEMATVIAMKEEIWKMMYNIMEVVMNMDIVTVTIMMNQELLEEILMLMQHFYMHLVI